MLYRQRKYKFIDRKQQLRFAGELAFYAVLFPILFLVIALGANLVDLMTPEGAGNGPSPVDAFVGFCIDHWWAALLAMVFVGFTSVLFSHRIFGPIRRFEIAITQKKRHPEEPVSCRLRQDDYFHGFSTILEDVLNRFQLVKSSGQMVEKKEVEAEEPHPPPPAPLQ